MSKMSKMSKPLVSTEQLEAVIRQMEGLLRRCGGAASLRRDHRLPGAAAERDPAWSAAGPLRLRGFGPRHHPGGASLGLQVYVFTRSEDHRQLARELGAVWVGGAEDTPPAKMHSSIIFAPAGGLVPEALRVLERGGTLSLAGVTMTPIPELDYDRLLYWEHTVRSVANFTRQDAEELLQVAAEIPIHTTLQTFPLEAANEALLALKRSEIDGMGVLVVGMD